MKSYKMEVSKKEDVKGTMQYVKQGEIEVFYPTLAELGFPVEPQKEDEEGFPVYEDSKAQYAFDAILAAVKAAARNKLKPGTATLKDGASIASTLEELLESGGANRGDALAAVREMLTAFKAWLPTTGKKETVQAAVYDLAANVKGLMLQTADRKAKFLNYLSDFAETLTAEQAARFERPLKSREEACAAVDAADEM